MVDMVVMGTDGKEGEMTNEEVVAELVAHLAGRTSPADWLTPLANFYAMMDDADRAYSSLKKRLVMTPGGWEALKSHEVARREQQAAYKAELAAASAAGLPLAPVAYRYGRTTGAVYIAAEKLGLPSSRPTIEAERLLAAAKPSMTITELAKAAGYKPDSVRNWVRRGQLDELFVLRKGDDNVWRIAKVRKEAA